MNISISPCDVCGALHRMVHSTRWGELTDAIRFHAGLVHAAEVPCEFRLLNDHPPVTIGVGGDGGDAAYEQFLGILDRSPTGGTPLCHHIREVTKEIGALATSLRANGHKAVVIIATDGESSDGDLAQAMAPLQNLPVWVVVRLCTDEDKVVNYWNSIDSQLELDMDVLDDLKGESLEVYQNGNNWLTYAEPLHRLREFGSPLRELDLIDEAKLSSEQMRAVIASILGGNAADYPHPDVDYKTFHAHVHSLNAREAKVYNPRSGKMCMWINEKNLNSSFNAAGGCSIA